MVHKLLLLREYNNNLYSQNIIENYIDKSQINLNIKIINQPLIKYDFIPNIDLNFVKQYQYIILTSKEATKIIVNNPHYFKDKKFIIIRGRIATILKNDNFIISHIYDSAKLIFRFLENANLKSHKILYLSGNYISIDMPSYIDRKICYNTIYKNTLNLQEIAIIKSMFENGNIVFFSSNSVLYFNKLITKYNLAKYIKSNTIYVFSTKIAEIAKKYYQNVLIFDKITDIINMIKST